MVEIKLTVANRDIAATRTWLRESRAGLIRGMSSPVPNAKSNRATLVYAMLGQMDRQIEVHQNVLKALEGRGR